MDEKHDIRWDKKQGAPKDPKVAAKVERASGRYGASEQSERAQRRAKKPRTAPKAKPRRGRRILGEL